MMKPWHPVTSYILPYCEATVSWRITRRTKMKRQNLVNLKIITLFCNSEDYSESNNGKLKIYF